MLKKILKAALFLAGVWAITEYLLKLVLKEQRKYREATAEDSIIGGADGPTSIFLAGKLGQTALMGPIAVAAYSYMSLVPIIQPPIMKALTTKKERLVRMPQLRPVTKLEKILFPIIVTVVVVLILPTTAPLVGMLMLGNLFRECGVVKQLIQCYDVYRSYLTWYICWCKYKCRSFLKDQYFKDRITWSDRICIRYSSRCIIW